ncbi:hypothetical protein BH10ACT7_BH10ACT7_19940 [soil metagenome]
MLTHDEALDAAAAEIALEAEYAGKPLGVRRELESPTFWVFYLDSVEAIQSARSADSLSYRLPPVVVNRRTGDVTRPIAAAGRLRAVELGAGEWFIAPEPQTRAPHDTLDGVTLTEEDRAGIERLRYFRVRRGGRDDGDSLDATIVAQTPDSMGAGLSAAGIRPDQSWGWTVRGRGRFSVSVDPERASVGFMVSQNGATDNSWSFGSVDIELALQIETALENADWIRFWY